MSPALWIGLAVLLVILRGNKAQAAASSAPAPRDLNPVRGAPIFDLPSALAGRHTGADLTYAGTSTSTSGTSHTSSTPHSTDTSPHNYGGPAYRGPVIGSFQSHDPYAGHASDPNYRINLANFQTYVRELLGGGAPAGQAIEIVQVG